MTFTQFGPSERLCMARIQSWFPNTSVDTQQLCEVPELQIVGYAAELPRLSK